ncbi:MAG: AIM24 family protein [Haloferacaceae archaeon]
MDLQEFVTDHAPAESTEPFELEGDKFLDVDVDGTVYAKVGTMVAYTGDLSFTGVSSAEGGVTGFIKEKATSEGTPVMKVEGTGHLYLADDEKKVQLLQLGPDDEVSVNGRDVLAFDDSVDHEIGTIDSLSGIAAGGLTNVYLSGPGYAAVTTHGDPLVLTPPVRTDPDATVAWSGVSPQSHADASIRDAIGRSSGETYQLEFTGDGGVVVVQPYEEAPTR